jgi:hypothetical protein
VQVRALRRCTGIATLEGLAAAGLVCYTLRTFLKKCNFEQFYILYEIAM